MKTTKDVIISNLKDAGEVKSDLIVIYRKQIKGLEDALQSIVDNPNASSRSLCYTAEQALKQ